MSIDNEKLKDLLIKLQILTNALIEERKKSATYLEKIKDLEKLLQKKDNEVVELTKIKFDLQASLTFEKSKSQKSDIINKRKSIDDKQINQYEAIINEQGFRLKDLNCKLENEKKNCQQQIDQYKIFLAEQNTKLIDFQKKYERANEEIKKLNERDLEQKQMVNELQKESKNYIKRFEEYQKDKVKVQSKNVELVSQLDELKRESYEKEKEISDLKKKNENMGVQLNEMKINLLNKKINTQTFKAENCKTKKVIEIVFQQNKTEDKYEMVIKGKNKKENEEVIDILDISCFQINEKDKCRVDIEYMVRKNQFYFL
jgi:chromosome segregation ATPase